MKTETNTNPPGSVALASRREPSVEDYVAGVRAGDRALLARAITLVESTAPRHREQAEAVLEALLPEAGGAIRVGLTGSPGVGKSSLIEVLGQHLVGLGHRVAVLAIDPSSSVSGGSLLGDKTRMSSLSTHPAAFIRPSPTAGTLGGVARRTRETLLLCEAGGYDVVLVETVGVGQSEALAAEMVDTLCLLLLAGAGDGLQGIKRGVLELADVLAITKADGDNEQPALQAAAVYRSALQLFRPRDENWRPPIQTLSAHTGLGIAELWAQILAHRAAREAAGNFESHRRNQRLGWLWTLVEEGLHEALVDDPRIATLLRRCKGEVEAGQVTPGLAARRLLHQVLGSSAASREDS